MYIVQSLRNIDGHTELAVDSDGDGFVDGSSNYQLIKDGSAIDLTNQIGQTFSDSSSNNWSAVKAITSSSGFQILLAGSNRFDGKFGVWDVNSSGVISSFSGWKSTTQALENGWESLFGDVIQPDGTIGTPGSGTPAPAPEPTPAPAPSPSPNPSLDSDGDGFVDGSSNYQLIKDGVAIDLTNQRGRTFSDSSNANWNAIKAIHSGSGFKVLLARPERFKKGFGIWDVNSSGVISSFSKWTSATNALENGWESLFGDVIQPDGTIGKPAPTPAVDSDGDGFADGSNNYQLIKDGVAIDLTNQGGRTFSDSSNANWNAVKAIHSGSGFKVLLARPERFRKGFGIWDVNSSGVISSFSKWTSTTNALENGWESLFGDVIQPDGTIGKPSNDGSAVFEIIGTPEINQTLRADLSSDDPDGNGTFSYTWQSSENLEDWSNAGTEQTLNIAASLVGKNIRVAVAYTDGEGFSETTTSDHVTINEPESGDDYNGDTNTTGSLDVNSSTTGAITDSEDRDWFSITLEKAQTYQFDLIGSSLADPQLNLRNQYGELISSNDDIGSELDSRITYTPNASGRHFLDVGSYNNFYTGSYTLSAISLEALTNDGTATFIISGTPLVNETLNAELTSSDPDGNGTFAYTWQSSSDQSNWTDVGLTSSFSPTSDLSNQWVRISIQYTDGEGFTENVTTEAVKIKTSQIGDDYSSDVNTTGIISVGSNSPGNLEESGDHDWFAVDLEEDKSYYFDAKGITLEDTLLYLRDNTGNLLKSDDDGGEGLDSRIEFRSSQTERFYLDIGSYNDELIGSYTISAEQIETTTPDTGEGFSSIDGYGHIDAARVFNQLLDINLPDAPIQGGNLWALDNLNVPEVWSGSGGFSGTKGAGSTVAVIDTGVDLDHPEFIDRITAGYDFVDNDSIADDEEGHGTHVAGTIAGSHDDGTGISGVAPESQIMPVRVLDSNGDGWTSDIVAGIRWATDNGADVINLSLGGGGYSQALSDAIRYASDRDSVVTMASGNYGGSSPEYPAAHAANYGLAVGAVDQDQNFADFSNRAGSIQMDYVTAPGVDIYSAVPDGDYAFANGTSMATPHVAGVAALLKSHDTSLTSEFIEDLITGTASNSISNTNQIFKEPVTNSSQLLTHETLDDLKLLPGNSRLIASLDGNKSTRKSTIKELKKFDQISNEITQINAIASTRKNFITIDLSLSKNLAPSQILEDWLNSDQFNYFEVDTQMSII